MAQQASDNWLTTATQRSGFYFHPLGMGCWHVVRKPADLPLLGIHQPANAIFRRVLINKRSVFIRHDATLAKGDPCWGLTPNNQVITFD